MSPIVSPVSASIHADDTCCSEESEHANVVETTTFLANAILLAVAIYVVTKTIATPHRSNYLVLGFFALLSLVILTNWAAGLLHIIPSAIGSVIVGAALLTLPAVLVHLAEAYSSVNQIIRRSTDLAFVASVGLLIYPGTDNPWVVLTLIGYIVAATSYAAYRFHVGSFDANGITRMRLRSLAYATVFLAIALGTIGLTTVLEGAIGTLIQIVRHFLLIGAALLFLVGFTPPVTFRRAWQEPELRSFLKRSMQLARWASPREVRRRLEIAVAETIGAPHASLGLWSDKTEKLDFGVVSVAPGETIGGRVFAEQRPIMSLDVTRDDPQSAELYEQAEANAVMAAPISTDEGPIGVISVHSPNPPIFAEDDLQLLTLLADQIGVLLENREYLRAQADLAAREESTRLKDEFLSVAAHDLKTPLTTILATGQFLERRFGNEDPASSELRSVRRLNREAIRLRTLVQGLLDASRIEQGQLVTHVEPADVSELLREAVQRAETYETHQFRVNIEPGRIVDCDGVRIQQVMENLIENAQKYSPQGSTIEIELRGGDGHVSFRISDEGIGILPEEQSRIFDRYYRSPGSESSSVKGIGLGLYICKAIVDEHGGEIGVQSTPGEGASFSFAIPEVQVSRKAGAATTHLEKEPVLQEHRLK
jgi:signal transduction histidine kinase